MAGTLTNNRLMNLNQFSEASWSLVQDYYENGTLSLQDRNLLLSEITKLLATLKDVPLLD
jgi:hypothetical protein